MHAAQRLATLSIFAFAPIAAAGTGMFTYVSQSRSIYAYGSYANNQVFVEDTITAPDFGPFNEELDVHTSLTGRGLASQNSQLDPESGLLISWMDATGYGSVNSSTKGGGRSDLVVTFELAQPATLYLTISIYAGRFSITGPGVDFIRMGGPYIDAMPIAFASGQYRVEASCKADGVASNQQAYQQMSGVTLSPLRVIPGPAQSAPTDSACQAVLPDFTLTSSADSSCGTTTITQSPAPGTIVGKGVTTVTLTATCASGATAVRTTTFTATDTTPPVINACAPAQSITAAPNGNAPAPSLVAAINASDSCGNITVTQSPTAGTALAIGPHTITLTVKDAANLTTTCPVAVRVTPYCPGDLNLNGEINTQDLVTFIAFFGQDASLFPRADLNGSGGPINTADLTAFLSKFGQTCP